MAEEEVADSLSVIVLSSDKNFRHILDMPGSDSVSDVYSRLTNVETVAGFALLSEDRRLLPQDIRLASLPQKVAGVVHFWADVGVLLNVGMFGRRESVQIAACLSLQVRDLFRDIRAAFPHLGERPFRLRTSNNVLDVDRSLSSQSVDVGTTLYVDCRIDVLLTDAEDAQRRNYVVFASQRLSDLSNVDERRQRFLLSDNVLPTSARFSDVLKDVPTSLSLLQVRQRRLYICTSGKVTQRLAWPCARLQDVQPSSGRLLVDKELLPPSATLHQAGIRSGTVLTDTVSVSLRLSDGQTIVATLTSAAVTEDVEKEVGRWETGKWTLMCAGRRMRSGERLPAEVTLGRKMVEVKKEEEDVAVTIGENTVRWRSSGRMTFEEFVEELARTCGEEVRNVCGWKFRCGCGRRVSAEEERRIPADCCPRRSLHMRVVETADAACQGATAFGPHAALLERSRSGEDATTQTQTMESSATTQTESVRLEATSTQTDNPGERIRYAVETQTEAVKTHTEAVTQTETVEDATVETQTDIPADVGTDEGGGETIPAPLQPDHTTRTDIERPLDSCNITPPREEALRRKQSVQDVEEQRCRRHADDVDDREPVDRMTSQLPTTRRVQLRPSYGFAICSRTNVIRLTPEFPANVFVKSVVRDSPADKANISAKDFLLEINGVDVKKSTRDEVGRMIANSLNQLTMTVTTVDQRANAADSDCASDCSSISQSDSIPKKNPRIFAKVFM